MIAGTGFSVASAGIHTRAESRQPSGMTMPMSGNSATLRGKVVMVFICVLLPAASGMAAAASSMRISVCPIAFASGGAIAAAGVLRRPVIGAIFRALNRSQMMPNTILAEVTASVSELKKNPMGTVAAGEGFPVAILNRNEPAFYCVPAKAFEAMMDRIEDIELNAIADARKGEQRIRVDLDEI
jgi:antitoxin StbD